VTVPVNRDVVPEPLGCLSDEIGGRLRRRDAERVDDDDLGRAGTDRRLVRAPEELEIGAAAVDAEEGDPDAVP
jgi:hypothetical protein